MTYTVMRARSCCNGCRNDYWYWRWWRCSLELQCLITLNSVYGTCWLRVEHGSISRDPSQSNPQIWSGIKSNS